MNPEIEDRIRLYCKKCHMDCTNLEIIPLEDSYLAKDKTVKMLFDKNGNVNSLPMNYTYGEQTTKFIGKYSSIFIYASFLIAILFLVLCGLLKSSNLISHIYQYLF